MKGYSLQLNGIVEPDWIDNNGHMNIKAYFELFERGSWKLWKLLEAEKKTSASLSMVAGRFYIEHRRELFEGAAWELWSGWVPRDERSLVFVHRIRAAENAREIVATCEVLASIFCLDSRKSEAISGPFISHDNQSPIPGYKPRLYKITGDDLNTDSQNEMKPTAPAQWFIVVFIIENKGNHAGLYIPGKGMADLSLAGARIVPMDDPKFPKGIPESFPINVPDPDKAISFLEKMGALCPEIIAQERAARGWHLNSDAPDYVLKLREKRSHDPENMNCVEWIVHALELGGASLPDDVLTPEQLRQWCQNPKTNGTEVNV